MHSTNNFEISRENSGKLSRSQNQIQKLKNAAHKLQKNREDKQGLKKACNKFETLFIKKLWKRIKDTLQEDGMFSSRIQKKYMSMFDQKFARDMSEKGGIGLSKFLYNLLKGQLETASKNTVPTNIPLNAEDANLAQDKDLRQEVKAAELSSEHTENKINKRMLPQASFWLGLQIKQLPRG